MMAAPTGNRVGSATGAVTRANDAGRPVTFVLSEHRYRLLRIEQQGEVDTDWWADAGRVWRRYVAATTLELLGFERPEGYEPSLLK